MKQMIIVSLLLIGLTACQPSTDAINEQVRTMMQAKFDNESALKPYKLVVSAVSVIHVEGNKFQGIATVTMDGKEHQVGVTVLDDGNNILYEPDKASFGFLAERIFSDAETASLGQ